MPFLGGLKLKSAVWRDSHSLRVRFGSTYTTMLYQLYAGRSLIGKTESFNSRAIDGTLQSSLWPEHIQLLAVETDQINTDYGDQLPDRPYNRAKLSVTVAGWDDAKYIDVVSGLIPGGVVDPSNRIHRELFDENREYTFITPTFHGTGNWNLEVLGRDDKQLEGNPGTSQSLNVDILSHPPDVQQRSDGTRLGVSVTGGVATVDFTEAIE